MKKWLASVELNWDASNVINVTVKANTERKARIFAEKEALKCGKNPKILSIKETS